MLAIVSNYPPGAIMPTPIPEAKQLLITNAAKLYKCTEAELPAVLKREHRRIIKCNCGEYACKGWRITDGY